tara:strand:+ start:228 stop:509 length:282 start_codon:yes stop_codon:yes gene_type:complete
MKFNQEHLTILKSGIDRVLNNNPNIIELYEIGRFARSEKVKDLQKRFCFDLFHASRIRIGNGIGTQGDIIGDYNNDHLYTALKQVCPKVTKRF